MIAPAGHHCNVRSGHLNATFGGKDMGPVTTERGFLPPDDPLRTRTGTLNSFKNWLGLQKQRISVVLHTAIAEQVVN